MKQWKIIGLGAALLAVLSFAVTIITVVRDRPTDAELRDVSNLPIQVIRQVEIAREEGIRRRGKIVVICDQNEHTRLLVRSRIPLPIDFKSTGIDEASVYFGPNTKIGPLTFHILALGSADTILSDRLRPDQVGDLQDAIISHPDGSVVVDGILSTRIQLNRQRHREGEERSAFVCSATGAPSRQYRRTG
jgi:hypothetical protein